MTSESPKRSRAVSPGAPSPGAPSPPPQGEAKRCREDTLSPPPQRQLPDYFRPASPERSGIPIPEVPSQEEAYRRAKRRRAERGRRPSVYIPSGQYDAEAEYCRDDSVSTPPHRQLPDCFGQGSPQRSGARVPESKKRPGSGAPEEDRRQSKCCRQQSSSDDESPSPSPPLLQPKVKQAKVKEQKAKPGRVVAGLIAAVSRHDGVKYPKVIETSDVFYDGVPSQKEVHAAEKRRGSICRGSSPLRDVSPEPTNGW